MTDIFHEIEEDLRKERMRRLWDRFGVHMIVLVVAIIAATAGWSGYRWWKVQQEQQSGARFQSAEELLREGKTAESEEAFAALAKDGTSGYRALARLRVAAELGARDKAAGAAAFDALAADGSLGTLTRDVARLRAGLLLVDSAPLAEVEQRVRPVADGHTALRFSAREILALAQLKAGDRTAANQTVTALLDDPEVPAALRNRAELLRTLTASAVPPTAPAASGAAPQ